MIGLILKDRHARIALILIGAIILIAIILIVIVSVKVEKACGCTNEHLCGAPDDESCGCKNEDLAPHYGVPRRGPMAPYGSRPLPRRPDSTFFRRNHWRGSRWYGPPPSNYYIAHNWHWPGPTDIDAVYWDGDKYAPCYTCKSPDECPTCPKAKYWFRGW